MSTILFIVSCSRFYFVQIQPISQKFNSYVTDGPTDGRMDGHTLIEMRSEIENVAFKDFEEAADLSILVMLAKRKKNLINARN